MRDITLKSLRERQKATLKSTGGFFKKPKDKIDNLEEKPYQPTRIRKAANFVFSFLFVLIVGGTGGILIDRFALPYLLVKYPELNRYEFLKRVSEHTTVIETTKEIKISEDNATAETIKKASHSIVQILEVDESGKFIEKGPGLILTSNGFIITSLENITPNEVLESQERNQKEKKNKERKTASRNKTFRVRTQDGNSYNVRFISKDLLTGLAIIKVDKDNLPVLPFADSSSINLGKKVIFISDSVLVDTISKLIDDYTPVQKAQRSKDDKAKPAGKKRIKTRFEVDDSFIGAPAINTKGEVIGISEGGNLVIPITEIEEFIEKSIQ